MQAEELLKLCTDTANKSTLKLKNPYSIKASLAPEFKTIFTNKMEFTEAATALRKFLDQDAKYYGLAPAAYHQSTINELYAKLNAATDEKKNAETWAKAELYMTDAALQIVKHIKLGRLFVDTSYKHFDSSLTAKLYKPFLDSLRNNPTAFNTIVQQYEPQFHDYDSLKLFLKNLIDNPSNVQKSFTQLNYQTKDSALLIADFLKRVQEENADLNLQKMADSAALATLISEYQTNYNVKNTGNITSDLVLAMNKKTPIDKDLIILTMDKFKNKKIQTKDAYVIVNIPAFTLRAFDKNGAALESKVAVGKVASKTPVMESEISDLIVMPNWYVPPSILKIPGYIERHRGRKNFIVRGKQVIQKGGPGNALGEMKFNFKSGDAIYLHDTNEKWAFGAKSRAVSHGCVRVQDYKKLAVFINNFSPLVERRYGKVIDKVSVDSLGDSTVKYKYVATDSVVHKTEVVTNMIKHKNHHELVVQNKVPVYINYMTCAIRNGQFVRYNDVYGYDKVLVEKYIKTYTN